MAIWTAFAIKLITRMHSKIAEFPSKIMYDSKLVTHSSVATHLLRHLPNITTSEDVEEVLETPIVFFDTAGCEYYERVDGDSDDGSRCNENEATIVNNWVETLVRSIASFGWSFKTLSPITNQGGSWDNPATNWNNYTVSCNPFLKKCGPGLHTLR
jgi:hypothetical protein